MDGTASFDKRVSTYLKTNLLIQAQLQANALINITG